MLRSDYVALFARVQRDGIDRRVHWVSGPRAGLIDAWDGTPETLPGTPSRLYSGSREAPDGVSFAEALMGRPHLLILGAGHVGTEVAAIGSRLGFLVTVVDPRREFADPARLVGADTVIQAPYGEALAGLPPYANSYVVIVTPGHALDRECAAACLRRPFEYLGMIGSRAKIATVRAALLEQGFTPAEFDAIHAPIGLPLGGREPAEIGVAICAQLIEVRSRRSASSFDPDVAAQVHRLVDVPTERASLATIVGHGGSVPRGAGSRMLVGTAGVLAGSVGGGAVEAAVIARAQELAATPGAVEMVDHDLSDREGADLGMICGGRVRVMLEAL